MLAAEYRWLSSPDQGSFTFSHTTIAPIPFDGKNAGELTLPPSVLAVRFVEAEVDENGKLSIIQPLSPLNFIGDVISVSQVSLAKIPATKRHSLESLVKDNPTASIIYREIHDESGAAGWVRHHEDDMVVSRPATITSNVGFAALHIS